MSEGTIIKRIGKIAQSGAGSEVYLKKEELEKVWIKQGDQVSIEFKTDGSIQIKKCGSDKRTTLFIDEGNWKKYEALRIEKLRRGEGDLYFTSYANIILANSNLTLEQITQELRRRQKNV